MKLLAEMRHLDVALGLTPAARLSLRWRLADPEWPVRRGSARAERLKVIDPVASAAVEGAPRLKVTDPAVAADPR